MSILIIIGTALLFGYVGFLAGQVRLHDRTIKRLSPAIYEKAESIARREAALRPKELELDRRGWGLSVQEAELPRERRRAEQAEQRLAAVVGDENRQRVAWLAGQLAAHLAQHDVASLLSRDSARVAAEMDGASCVE